MNIDVSSLEIDPERRGPLAEYGEVWRGRVGSFWTLPVDVPLTALRGLGAHAIDRNRLHSVRSAYRAGVELPPIEIAITPDGQNGWLIDGHHRLVAARRRRDPSIDVIFTVIGR